MALPWALIATRTLPITEKSSARIFWNKRTAAGTAAGNGATSRRVP